MPVRRRLGFSPMTPALRRVRPRLMTPGLLAGLAALRRTRAATRIQRAFRSRFSKKAAASKKAKANSSLPKYRIGRQMGTFGKKGPKPKPLVGATLRTNHDFEPVGSEVCYFGSTIAPPRDHVMFLVAQHIVMDIYKRSGMNVAAWTGPTKSRSIAGGDNGRLKKIRFEFNREDQNGEVTTSFADIVIGTTVGETPADLAGDIRTAIRDKAILGYYCSGYKLFDFDDSCYYRRDDFGDDIITLYFTTKARIQNITPTDDHNASANGVPSNINDVGANPLRGRVYDFAHGGPRLKDEYQRSVSDVAGFAEIAEVSRCTNSSTQTHFVKLREDSTGPEEGRLARAFRQPPNGAAVFKNCIGAKPVNMPPGGFYTLMRTQTVKASFRRLTFGIYEVDTVGTAVNVRPQNPPIVMKAFALGLAPTVRHENLEVVKLVVNIDRTAKCTIKRRKIPNAPAYVVNS
jgi:hypothetical protein